MKRRFAWTLAAVAAVTVLSVAGRAEANRGPAIRLGSGDHDILQAYEGDGRPGPTEDVCPSKDSPPLPPEFARRSPFRSQVIAFVLRRDWFGEFWIR